MERGLDEMERGDGLPRGDSASIGNATLFSWRFRIELDLVVTAAAACH